MKCPICISVDLLMTERQGVEIDYCPQCRGIWLDRGELDKIIELSNRIDNQTYPDNFSGKNIGYDKHHVDHHYDDDYDDDEHRRKQYDKYGRPMHRKGGMRDLFGGLFD